MKNSYILASPPARQTGVLWGNIKTNFSSSHVRGAHMLAHLHFWVCQRLSKRNGSRVFQTASREHCWVIKINWMQQNHGGREAACGRQGFGWGWGVSVRGVQAAVGAHARTQQAAPAPWGPWHESARWQSDTATCVWTGELSTRCGLYQRHHYSHARRQRWRNWGKGA